MVDALLLADAEAQRVLTIVAVEEHEVGDRTVGAGGAVLDPAAHAEKPVEPIRGVEAEIADEAVPHTGGAGGEAAIHASSGIERFAILGVGTVEQLNRIAVRIIERHHLQHVAIRSEGARADGVAHARLLKASMHFGEFLRPRNPEAERVEIVAAILLEDEAMVPGIHPQIAAPRLALIDQLEAEDFGRILLPAAEAGDAEAQIAEFRHADHVLT